MHNATAFAVFCGCFCLKFMFIVLDPFFLFAVFAVFAFAPFYFRHIICSLFVRQIVPSYVSSLFAICCMVWVAMI